MNFTQTYLLLTGAQGLCLNLYSPRADALQFGQELFSVVSRSAVDSAVGIATRYGLDGPGIESRCGGEIFLTRPDRPWVPSSLLHNGYRVKRPGRVVDYPPPSSAEVKGRVELYLYSFFGPSWLILR